MTNYRVTLAAECDGQAATTTWPAAELAEYLTTVRPDRKYEPGRLARGGANRGEKKRRNQEKEGPQAGHVQGVM